MKSILIAIVALVVGAFFLYKKLDTTGKTSSLYTGLAILSGIILVIALLEFPKEMRRKRIGKQKSP